jgi:hypothetical protein
MFKRKNAPEMHQARATRGRMLVRRQAQSGGVTAHVDRRLRFGSARSRQLVVRDVINVFRRLIGINRPPSSNAQHGGEPLGEVTI